MWDSKEKSKKNIHADWSKVKFVLITIAIIAAITAAIWFIAKVSQTTQLKSTQYYKAYVVDKDIYTTRHKSGKTWVTRKHHRITLDVNGTNHKMVVSLAVYNDTRIGDPYTAICRTYHNTWLGIEWNSWEFRRGDIK